MNSSKPETDAERAEPGDLIYVEDMAVGDVWVTEPREVTGDDVADFALLTGDNTALHATEGVASPFGEPVAHGLLGLSVMAGLSSVQPNAATLALVAVDRWEFLAPIFFGDRVHVKTEIESIEPHGRRAARIGWFRRLVNQDGRVVQQGRLTTLVATKSRAKRPAPNSDPANSPNRAK